MRDEGVVRSVRPPAFVRAVERAVFVSALAVGALVFFRPTRPLGRVLLAIWFVVAWPLAWVGRAVETRPVPSPGPGEPRPL